MKEKISINDIATRLNISKTTVSFILNGKAKEKRISDALVKKVLKFVDEVGYRPNQFAQSLRTGKTKILGLMVEDISNPFFASIARNIEEKAYENNYKIIYCSTENDSDRAKEFLNMFYNLGVDGYILTPPPGLVDDIQTLINRGEKIIFLDRTLEEIEAEFVMVNNQESTYKGTLHLIEQGYTNIAFITIESEQTQMQERLRGYQKALSENNLEQNVFEVPYNQVDNKSVLDIKGFISKNKDLDAIFFSVNYLGVNGLEAISQLNLKIPEDLAVLSFDDNDLFRVSKPSISSLAQPIEKIAETVITGIIDKINAKDEEEVKDGIFLPTDLIIRESTTKKINGK